MLSDEASQEGKAQSHADSVQKHSSEKLSQRLRRTTLSQNTKTKFTEDPPDEYWSTPYLSSSTGLQLTSDRWSSRTGSLSRTTEVSVHTCHYASPQHAAKRPLALAPVCGDEPGHPQSERTLTSRIVQLRTSHHARGHTIHIASHRPTLGQDLPAARSGRQLDAEQSRAT